MKCVYKTITILFSFFNVSNRYVETKIVDKIQGTRNNDN